MNKTVPPRQTVWLLLSLALLIGIASCATQPLQPAVISDKPRMPPLPADLLRTPPSPSSYLQTQQEKQAAWQKRLDDWRPKPPASNSTGKPASN